MSHISKNNSTFFSFPDFGLIKILPWQLDRHHSPVLSTYFDLQPSPVYHTERDGHNTACCADLSVVWQPRLLSHRLLMCFYACKLCMCVAGIDREEKFVEWNGDEMSKPSSSSFTHAGSHQGQHSSSCTLCHRWNFNSCLSISAPHKS